MITYISEHVAIKGNKTSLKWIMNFLMERSVSFTWDRMTQFVTFVQICPEDRTCGELSDLQRIIIECPYKGWDIVSRFPCSYCDILSQ